jgi:hypothetical protein
MKALALPRVLVIEDEAKLLESRVTDRKLEGCAAERVASLATA